MCLRRAVGGEVRPKIAAAAVRERARRHRERERTCHTIPNRQYVDGPVDERDSSTRVRSSIVLGNMRSRGAGCACGALSGERCVRRSRRRLCARGPGGTVNGSAHVIPSQTDNMWTVPLMRGTAQPGSGRPQELARRRARGPLPRRYVVDARLSSGWCERRPRPRVDTAAEQSWVAATAAARRLGKYAFEGGGVCLRRAVGGEVRPKIAAAAVRERARRHRERERTCHTIPNRQYVDGPVDERDSSTRVRSSDSRTCVGLGSGRPVHLGLPEAEASSSRSRSRGVGRPRVPPRTRGASGSGHRVPVAPALCSWTDAGLPGAWAVPFAHAAVQDPAGSDAPSPMTGTPMLPRSG